MPRVVIELQANTQQAVQQIQQFAKAQKDAFDAVRASSPALNAATISVSQFTAATQDAGKGALAANQALRTLGSQGIATLAHEIPGVGGALSALGQTLGTFPLLIGAVVGAGLGLLKMLQGWGEEATKSLANITKLSESIGTDFRNSILEVQKIRAQAAGDEGQVILLGVQQALEAAETIKNARIAAAKEELNQLDLLGRKRTELSQKALVEIAAAEAQFENKRRVLEAQGMADFEKLQAQRVAAHEAALAKELAAVEAAAAQERQIWTQTTQDAIAIFQGLGAGFEEALKPLQLEQWVAKTQKDIATLNTAIDQGRDSQGLYAKAVEVLTTKMNEAIKLGYVPMTEAAKTATAAITDSGTAIEATTQKVDKFTQALQDLVMIQKLQAQSAATATAGYVAQSEAYAGAAADAARAYAQTAELQQTIETVRHAPITSRQDIENMYAYSAAMTFTQGLPHAVTPGAESYQHGGLVPGVGPVPIIAHGGERIVPVHGESGGGAVQVHIEPGAVQLSGTIIDQQRGWGSLVEELGQALEARLRRRGR
jgi:hypothetical protein